MQFLPVIGDEEEPVAAPGNVADDPAVTRHVEWHALAISVAWHVPDRRAAIRMQGRRHNSHRRFDAVFAGRDAAQMSQGDGEADGAVAAHAEHADVVEEDYARVAR